MLTPEIQEYIKQQQAAGVSDVQIRQALASRGWQQADLDQAFGTAPTRSAVPQAPVVFRKNTTKIVITIVVIFLVLPLLFWALVAGLAWYKFKNSGINFNQPPSTTSSSNSKKQLNCDDSSGSILLPSNWPSDLPVYPGSKFLSSESLNILGEVQVSSVSYCSKDGVEQIAKFFIDSTYSWKFSGTESSSGAGGQSYGVMGQKLGSDGEMIGNVAIKIENSGNEADTLIYLQYFRTK